MAPLGVKMPGVSEADRKAEARIQSVIEAYNANVFDGFSNYAVACTQGKKLEEEDVQLPFSKRAILGTESGAESGLAALFRGGRIRTQTRAPMASLAGNSDEFADPYDLVDCVRRHLVRLDTGSLPLFLPEGRGSPQLERVNSWILDFYLHGKLHYLTPDNGISASESWQMVKNFNTSLHMLCVALKEIAPEADIVRSTTEELYKLMRVRLANCNA
jgi:hypothetical protein